MLEVTEIISAIVGGFVLGIISGFHLGRWCGWWEGRDALMGEVECLQKTRIDQLRSEVRDHQTATGD